MNSSSRETAAAANAETRKSESTVLPDSVFTDPPTLPNDQVLGHAEASVTPPPVQLDPNDFDHEFDDDFEAEIPGEYELEDDEYARALLDIVDFDIEGLEAYRDDDDEEDQDDQQHPIGLF